MLYIYQDTQGYFRTSERLVDNIIVPFWAESALQLGRAIADLRNDYKIEVLNGVQAIITKKDTPEYMVTVNELPGQQFQVMQGAWNPLEEKFGAWNEHPRFTELTNAAARILKNNNRVVRPWTKHVFAYLIASGTAVKFDVRWATRLVYKGFHKELNYWKAQAHADTVPAG